MEIVGVVERMHDYIVQQGEVLDAASYNVVLASSARSTKAQIDQIRCGLSTEDATTLMDRLRAGPWTPVQINAFGKSVHAASERFNQVAEVKEDRKPQACDHPEIFLSDRHWESILDPAKPRQRRMHDLGQILMSMDLSNPNPACKQRCVAMLSLGDSWIQQSPTNAKVALDEFTVALQKIRPPPSV